MKDRSLIQKMTRILKRKYKLSDISVLSSYNGRKLEDVQFFYCDKKRKSMCYNIFTKKYVLDNKIIEKASRFTLEYAFEMFKYSWFPDTALTRKDLKKFKEEYIYLHNCKFEKNI